MVQDARRTVWSRAYAVSTWTLIAYFSAMAAVHLVLTVLFYLGVWDTGVGYVLDFDVPAWLITILDGAAASLLWAAYRNGTANPWLGLGLTLAASVIMIGRALWFVVIPLMVAVTIAGSIRRITTKDANETHS